MIATWVCPGCADVRVEVGTTCGICRRVADLRSSATAAPPTRAPSVWQRCVILLGAAIMAAGSGVVYVGMAVTRWGQR